MDTRNFDTLSEATNALRAKDNKIEGSRSDKKYNPDELKIVNTFRFEGMTNPGDDTMVFAIEADDGNKGTLVMSYSSKHDQNVELIKKIPKVEK